MPRYAALSGKGRRVGTQATPPWGAELMVVGTQFRTMEDDLARTRARLALMCFLGARYFGASQEWIAKKIGVHQVKVHRYVGEGKQIALAAGGDLEDLVEMIWGAEMVKLGWDGAGASGG